MNCTGRSLLYEPKTVNQTHMISCFQRVLKLNNLHVFCLLSLD